MAVANERAASWLDDPEKTTVAVTVATLGSFAILHETLPTNYQDMSVYLGAADFVYNVATWVAIRRNRDNQTASVIADAQDDKI